MSQATLLSAARGGLVSDLRIEEILLGPGNLLDGAADLACDLHDPFMAPSLI
jgi:adenine deaminase